MRRKNTSSQVNNNHTPYFSYFHFIYFAYHNYSLSNTISSIPSPHPSFSFSFFLSTLPSPRREKKGYIKLPKLMWHPPSYPIIHSIPQEKGSRYAKEGKKKPFLIHSFRRHGC